MPLYEYKCTKCDAALEVIQKFSDAPLKACTKCRGKLERIISSPAFQFKGSGWYVTDYQKKSNGGATDKSEETKSSSEETKPSSEKTTTPSKGEKTS